MWVALEFNILAFLPIMSSESGMAFENTIKYFLIQRWASIIFLSRILFSVNLTQNLENIAIFSIFIKLGLAPFHGWFVSIINTCSLWILVILSTIQKIIPIVIVSQIFISVNMVFFFSILNLVVVFSIAMRVVFLNKLLAISSLNNLIWFIFRSQIKFKLFLFFIMIYLISLTGILILYNKTGIVNFLQIRNLSIIDKLFRVFIFMSLGGIPPFLGFLGKLVVLKALVAYLNLVFVTGIIISALIIVYMYMSRVFFILRYSPNTKLITVRSRITIPKYAYLILLRFISVFIIIFSL